MLYRILTLVLSMSLFTAVAAAEVAKENVVEDGNVKLLTATFKSGDSPFSKNQTVIFKQVKEGYLIRSKDGKDMWKLSLGKLRGAQTSSKGLWIYWFTETDETRSAFFTTRGDSQKYSDQINARVKEYNENPIREEASKKQKIESLEQEALKQSI